MGEYLNRYIRGMFPTEQAYQDYISRKIHVQWKKTTSTLFSDIYDMEEALDQNGISGPDKETFMNLFTSYADARSKEIDALERNAQGLAASLRQKVQQETSAQGKGAWKYTEPNTGQLHYRKPAFEIGQPALYILKGIGKYFLLMAIHIGIMLVCGLSLAFIFDSLMETEFGSHFVYYFTGGMPFVTVVLVPCLISYFVCSEVADRINGCRHLLALGITILISSVACAIYNLYHGTGILIPHLFVINNLGILPNIIQAILGVAFIRSNSRTNAQA